MALIFMDGFDAGDLALRWTSVATFTPATTTRFGVGRSVMCNQSSGNIRKSFLPQAKTIFGFAFMVSSLFGATPVVQLWGDNATTNHLNLLFNANGSITLQRGGGITLATSAAGLIVGGAWAYIEMSATIDDSTGRATVKVNNTTVIDFTGDTRNGGTSATLDQVQLYLYGVGNPTYYDDFYLLDGTGSAPLNDFLGDCRVYTLVPTGPGATTGLTPSTGANWSCVDELPYSATDYVSGSTAALKDTYATADLPAGVTSVFGMQLNNISRKSDVGARAIKNVVRRGGTDYPDAASTNLATSDGVVSTVRGIDPSTAAAWAVAGVNAMEIGVEVA